LTWRDNLLIGGDRFGGAGARLGESARMRRFVAACFDASSVFSVQSVTQVNFLMPHAH
jgi:hypothetical protein